jgi:hypothetical protein
VRCSPRNAGEGLLTHGKSRDQPMTAGCNALLADHSPAGTIPLLVSCAQCDCSHARRQCRENTDPGHATWTHAKQHTAMLQAFSTCLFLVLSLGWLLGARWRARELQRHVAAADASASAVQATNGQAACAQQSNAKPASCGLGSCTWECGATEQELPPVTLVLPIGLCRPRTRANWQRQLSMCYPGRVEYLFIAADIRVPAYRAACKVVKTWCMPQGCSAHVIYAGLAQSCSQKNKKCAIFEQKHACCTALCSVATLRMT